MSTAPASNKRPREFAYQEPSGPPIPQPQQSGNASFMGYYPQGMPPAGAPQMYSQMPTNGETPMALPPLYVGPPMGMPVPSGQVVNSEQQAAIDSANAKKKHTSQWALEKRRARNRVTAAESRKKSKSEALLLKDEVGRLGVDLKVKNDILQDFKDKLEMYEQGSSKEDIEQFISQRRVAAAAAVAAMATTTTDAPSAGVPSLGGLVAVAQANTPSHSQIGQSAEL